MCNQPLRSGYSVVVLIEEAHLVITLNMQVTGSEGAVGHIMHFMWFLMQALLSSLKSYENSINRLLSESLRLLDVENNSEDCCHQTALNSKRKVQDIGDFDSSLRHLEILY